MLEWRRQLAGVQSVASSPAFGKSRKPSHAADVLAMRAVAWGLPGALGHVLSPDELAGQHASQVQSAFKVFGFDCQVPPVIVARVE